MTKVCRLCLQKLQRGSKYFNINAVESFTGFMPYRDQLTTCIPEMALDLIPNPVICNYCRTALKSAYDFKSRCLLVEKKIREYIEAQSESEVNYDLSQISLRDLPPNKISFLHDLESDETTSTATGSEADSDSLLLKQLQKEIILPASGEIEVTPNSSKRNGKYSVFRGRPPKSTTSPAESNNGSFVCSRCWKKFSDAQTLAMHSSVHGDDFVCNFCNEGFRSLQNLRRHNSNCPKATNKIEKNAILTKRPHLPTKAKNHLKRWLFRHTDHPYPTDHEKQMLMQETNLTLLQVENWFINARRRILQDLTKLKNHGVTCDEVTDNTIGLQMDLEEIVASHSPPPLNKGENVEESDNMEDIEEAIPPTAIIKIKPDPDLQEDPLEIKSEIMDDR